jgi:hypothetical protein
MWAVLLGVLLVLAAATSSHAAGFAKAIGGRHSQGNTAALVRHLSRR